MRIPSRVWKSLAAVLLGLVLLVIAVREWGVRALIARQIEARLGGRAQFKSWWLNNRSAGVIGLTLREGPAADSPAWATAERVTTDLSLPGLLSGKTSPRKITVLSPSIILRFNRTGELLTRIGPASSGGTATVPLIVAQQGRVTLSQEGRHGLTVDRVTCRLATDQDGVLLSLRSSDRQWGPLQAFGRFDASLRSGTVELTTPHGILVNAKKAHQLPFVPPEVWNHVVPSGPVDLRLTLRLGPGVSSAARVVAEINLRDTVAQSPGLDLTATHTKGRVIVEGGLVRLEKVEGQAIDGTVEANGTLDFTRSPARCDVRLRLAGINVADAPPRWQLGEAGITGRLFGDARLLARLGSDAIDLTGSSGEAVVKGGSVQGIPVKSLRLVMRAQGNDLQFETGEKKTNDSESAVRPLNVHPRSISAPPRIVPSEWLEHCREVAAAVLVALEAPKGKAQGSSKGPRIKLPGTITTHIELEDVEMSQLVAKAQFLTGFPFPIPITGKLSLKADATIPLGKLRDVKAYAFHGTLELKAASIYKVDFGHLTSRIDLADGVLDLRDLRGRLANHPDGGPDNPPAAEPPVPAEGPLPPGAFRADLRAELSPPGPLTAKFEGTRLPLGELAAPMLPRPTPVSGLFTIHADARADLSNATSPDAWTVSGRADSERITYRGAALDRVSFRFDLERGHLNLPNLAAQLAGRPLSAKIGLDLNPPRAFDATLDVDDWDLTTLLALVPTAPRPAPVAGALSAKASARGTLSPVKIDSQGEGRLTRFIAGPVPLGTVPFRWTTEKESILLSVLDAHPFGGRLSATVRVPNTTGRSTVGAVSLVGIDTAQLAAALRAPDLRLTGRAGGRIDFSIPPGAPSLTADVRLDAPDLTVQGLPAEHVRASVSVRKSAAHYELTADSLGGKIKFSGDVPLAAAPPSPPINGELRFVGFRLSDVWTSPKVKAPASLAKLDGLAAIDANVRLIRAGPAAGLWAHAIAEIRDLRFGTSALLGRLKGIISLLPDRWRVEPLSGNLLGGVATGFLWGSSHPAPGEPRLGFEMQIDQISFKQALAMQPQLASAVDANGTLRVAGSLGDTLRATADLEAPRGRVAGLPLSEFRAPADLVYLPSAGTGTVNVRRLSARLAGGQVRGDATFNLGLNRAFHGDLTLAGVDLQTLILVESDARQPATGRISGRISLNGTEPADTRTYRGRITLDLDDASLVSLPVFREIDQFLGAARGGLFEDGDLVASIANRQVNITTFTLVGRLAQLHAAGTVGFDGQLNLEVLINTNQIISQTGQALVSVIPGLGGLAGRRAEAAARFSDYLSNKLLKLRVTGTVRNPTINADPGVLVAETAVGFFGAILKLPLGLLP